MKTEGKNLQTKKNLKYNERFSFDAVFISAGRREKKMCFVYNKY